MGRAEQSPRREWPTVLGARSRAWQHGVAGRTAVRQERAWRNRARPEAESGRIRLPPPVAECDGPSGLRRPVGWRHAWLGVPDDAPAEIRGARRVAVTLGCGAVLLQSGQPQS